MKCSKCGAYVPELDAVCPKCGAEVWTVGELPPQAARVEREEEKNEAAGSVQSAREAVPADAQTEEAQPMRWYKFLVYFALFTLCAYYIYRAVRIASGRVYFDAHTAEVVYAYYPNLETLNWLLCALYVLLAGLSVVTRQKLARMRASAPVLSTVLFALCAVVPLLSARLSANATGLYAFRFIDGAAFVFFACVAYFNHVYFSRRKELFSE